MHAVFFVIASIIVALVYAQYPTCAIPPPQQPPHQPSPPLDYCTDEYPGVACCNVTQSDQIRDNFNNILIPMFGDCQGCVTDFKLLWCGYTCSPDQGSFVDFHSVDTHGDYVTTFHVNIGFCNAFYAACGNANMGGVAVKQLFPTALSWCKYAAYTQPITIVVEQTGGFNHTNPATTC